MTKEELRQAIDEATTSEQLDELQKEIDKVEVVEEVKEEVVEEVVQPVVEETTEVSESVEDVKAEPVEEERSLLKNALEKRAKNLKIMEEKMEERKFGTDSREYRSAWAKKLMGVSEDKFTAEEVRALGDAVTTTATTYVAADATHNGVNNGGLLIPDSLREDFMEIIKKQSPIFNDIRKLSVKGNIDLPYLFGSDDAAWYAEASDTVNEGIEFKNLQLTGWELAKDIVITWKAEEMTVESFISFLLEEMAQKMGAKLINAVIYGDGSGKPTGLTNGLTAVANAEGDTPVDVIINTFKELSTEAKIGAKAYIASDVELAIIGYQDGNGNYPFLGGSASIKGLSIEVDPYLSAGDIVIGNMRNYVLNEHTPVRIDKEISVKGRKVTYGAYAIYDGKAKPNSFAYGTYTVSSDDDGE